MKNRTNIDATSTYEIDGVCIFETDVTAVVDWERNGELLDWEIIAFILTSYSGSRKTVSIGKTHPLFGPVLEGINGIWLEEQLIEIEAIRIENNR